MDIVCDGGCPDWVKLRSPLVTQDVFVKSYYILSSGSGLKRSVDGGGDGGPNRSQSWLFLITRKAYYLIHRKVAATEMLLMGGLSTGLVSNPSRASIEAQTEKVKAALVRGESFDSGKPFSPGESHAPLSQLL